jgi:hypothetical protein
LTDCRARNLLSQVDIFIYFNCGLEVLLIKFESDSKLGSMAYWVLLLGRRIRIQNNLNKLHQSSQNSFHRNVIFV